MKMGQEYINRRPCERQLLWLSQRKLIVKTVIGNSSNSSSHGERAKNAFLFCHHKEQQCHKMMSKGYNPNGPHLNKKKIVHTEKNSWMFGEFGFRRSSLRSLTW